MTTTESIAQQIKTIRTMQGITQTELAGRVKSLPGFISNLEAGKNESLSLRKLEQIAKQLRCKVVISIEPV
jgi:transcriptional regulator with XRE-family HTH domain